MRALKTGTLAIAIGIVATFFFGCAGTGEFNRAGYDILADAGYSLFAGQEMDMSGAAGGGDPVVPVLSPVRGDGITRSSIQTDRGFTVAGADGTVLEFLRLREAVSGISGGTQTIAWDVPEGVIVLARLLDFSGEGFPAIDYSGDSVVSVNGWTFALLTGGADANEIEARFSGMAENVHALGIDPYPLPAPAAADSLSRTVGREPDEENSAEVAAFNEGVHPTGYSPEITSFGAYAAVLLAQMDAPGTFSMTLDPVEGRDMGKWAEGVTFWAIEDVEGAYSVSPVTEGATVDFAAGGEGIVVAIHEAGGFVDPGVFGRLRVTYKAEVASFDEGELREVGVASPAIALEIRGSVSGGAVVAPLWLELSGAVSIADLDMSDGVFATPFHYVRGASASSAPGAPLDAIRRIGRNGAESFAMVSSAGSYPTVDVITLLRVAPVDPGTAASFTIRVYPGATGGSDVVDLAEGV